MAIAPVLPNFFHRCRLYEQVVFGMALAQAFVFDQTLTVEDVEEGRDPEFL